MRNLFTWLLFLLLLGRVSYGQVIHDAADTTSLAQDLRASFSTLNPTGSPPAF